jgi:hypothetical protein
MLASIQTASNALDKVAEAKDAVVHARVHLGKPKGHDGYGLEVELEVEGISQELVDAGHKVRFPEINSSYRAEISDEDLAGVSV